MISAILLALCLQTSGVMKQSIHLVKERTAYMVETPSEVVSITGEIFEISPEDISYLERCVMTEAGGESNECQEAVATVILNRMCCPDKYGNTVYDVIFAENQFAIKLDCQPTVSVRLAVHNAILYYNSDLMCIPYQTYYFRADHYHNFGIPYCSIDHTFFSLDFSAILE